MKARIIGWRSIAQWPRGVVNLGDPNNESTDDHGTQEQARAVCQILIEKGFGGDRRIFPLATRVEPIYAAHADGEATRQWKPARRSTLLDGATLPAEAAALAAEETEAGCILAVCCGCITDATKAALAPFENISHGLCESCLDFALSQIPANATDVRLTVGGHTV